MAKYIVTGGTGFLGSKLCARLKQLGHCVVSIARGKGDRLEKEGIKHKRVDISNDRQKLVDIFKGASAVFHTASKVDMVGRFKDFYATNVVGTRNVIDACREAGVNKLVYTSSPSVVAGKRELNGVDEHISYPKKHLAPYPATKQLAEELVLNANGADLWTIALRPHLIFGVGDTHLLPTIIERCAKGTLKRIGNRKVIVDFTHVDDCVDAHILAEQALDVNSKIRGKALFITQDDPIDLWVFINRICSLLHLPPVERSIPKPIAYLVAGLMEIVYHISFGYVTPSLTRFLVHEMSANHYFNISFAKKELGYKPKYKVLEALEMTLAKDSSYDQIANEAA